jgi:hypothetical protein
LCHKINVAQACDLRARPASSLALRNDLLVLLNGFLFSLDVLVDNILRTKTSRTIKPARVSDMYNMRFLPASLSRHCSWIPAPGCKAL